MYKCFHKNAEEVWRCIHGRGHIGYRNGKLRLLGFYPVPASGDPDSSMSLFKQMSEKDVISWTSLVVAYTRASRLEDAFRIFIQMPAKNTVSWTALMSGFAQNGHGDQALSLFSRMQEEEKEEGVVPNTLTFVTVLSVCADQASIERGKEIHGHIIRANINADSNQLSNVYLSNALIDMYCKSGDIKSAEKLFDRMPERDIVSWNTLATGLAQNSHGKEAIQIIDRMIRENTKPNHVTFLALLSACCHTGMVSEGLKIIHSMERNHRVIPSAEHFALIIDLLGKTTRNGLNEAIEFIEKSRIGSNHVGLWGAILGACRAHGNLRLAEKVTKKLLELDPENAGRHVMVSNIYAEIGMWEDVERVRKGMKANRLRKESGYSSVEANRVRFNFVANLNLPCGGREDEVCDLLHCIKVHMEDR